MRLSKLLPIPIAIAALVLITNPARAQHGTNGAAGCTSKVVGHSLATSTTVRKSTAVRTPTTVRKPAAVRTAVVYVSPMVVYVSPMIGPRVVVSPLRSSESFYVFRPQLNLGSGLWVGSPISLYPSVAVASSPYSIVSVTPEPVSVPPVANGGLSFEIAPTFARIYVDGNYVGTAADFSGIRTPLILPPGPHHVRIRAEDFRTITFNTEIFPGQIVPYRGVMESHKS
jgi:hypothetical protein